MTDYDNTTALVVVDCQNDFADPEGSLFVTGGEDVIAEVNRHVVRAIAAGAPVLYTQDWHPQTTPHFQKDGGVWPVHCVADSWGAQFHPRLLVAGPSIKKGVHGEDGYSGFTMADPESGEETPTPLDGKLKEMDVATAVVVGLALDYCVKATAEDAIRLGYTTVLPQQATAAVNMNEGDDARTIEELTGAGVRLA